MSPSKPREWTISIRANPILFGPNDGLQVGATTYVYNHRADPAEYCAKPEDFAYFVEHASYAALLAEAEALREALAFLANDGHLKHDDADPRRIASDALARFDAWKGRKK